MLATFGMGCFWCSQDAFKKIKGIKNTVVGYMGGKTINPSYTDVCRGDTGHTEVVQVEYNPKTVSYNELLDVFFKNHDSTQLNKQGPDKGYQYRSVIFYHNKSQHDLSIKLIKELKKSKNIVTTIEPASIFYKAEDYHQDYYDKNKIIKIIKEGRL